MKNEEIAIINLKNFDSIKEALEPGSFHDPLVQANGMAILFSSQPKSNSSLQIEMLHFAINQLYSRIKGMESISQHSSTGEIDPELKDFLCQTLMMNQWLFNSYSVNSGEFKEFAEFDKMDLKEQLLRLAQRL